MTQLQRIGLVLLITGMAGVFQELSPFQTILAFVFAWVGSIAFLQGED